MKSHQDRWLWGLLALLAAGAVGYWFANRPYGEVSQAGYAYATALFSACNQQDEGRLNTIAAMVADAEGAGDLHAREARWLRQIIGKGLDGNWQQASRAVRKLMEDQRRKAPPLPH